MKLGVASDFDHLLDDVVPENVDTHFVHILHQLLHELALAPLVAGRQSVLKVPAAQLVVPLFHRIPNVLLAQIHNFLLGGIISLYVVLSRSRSVFPLVRLLLVFLYARVL